MAHLNPLVESIQAMQKVGAPKAHALRMGGGEPHADYRQGEHRARNLDLQDVLSSNPAPVPWEAGAGSISPYGRESRRQVFK